MNSYYKLLKAIAVSLHFYNIVQSSHPFPPFAVERRRWRLAKSQMFDAFDVHWGKASQALSEQGDSWVRIIDAEAINYGRFALDSGIFGVVRITQTAPQFFELMTDLLLVAAWTEA